MTQVASRLASKAVVSPKGKTLRDLMRRYGSPAGYAAYYGYKNGTDYLAVGTMRSVGPIEMKRLTSIELGGSIIVHYCHKTNTVAQLIHGLGD